MKKSFLYTNILIALFAFSSCDEDFNDEVAAPQKWEQEDMANVSKFILTPVESINLETVQGNSVKLFNSTVENQVEHSTLNNLSAFISKPNEETWGKIEVTSEGETDVETLQKAIEHLYNKEFIERTICLKANINMIINGQALLIESNPIEIKVTPKKPVIVPEYYLLGNLQGWSMDDNKKICALYPIDLEKNIFSITTNFSNNIIDQKLDGSPNFKLISCNDFGNWDKAIGTPKDGDTSLEGTLVEKGGAIQTPDKGIYTLTVNLLDMSYKLEKVEVQKTKVFQSISLIGNFNQWSGDELLLQSSEHNWYIKNFKVDADGEIKFRADKDWKDSWGDKINIGDNAFGALKPGGDNMTIPKGTYDVYFNDITGRFAFFAK